MTSPTKYLNDLTTDESFPILKKRMESLLENIRIALDIDGTRRKDCYRLTPDCSRQVYLRYENREDLSIWWDAWIEKNYDDYIVAQRLYEKMVVSKKITQSQMDSLNELYYKYVGQEIDI